MKKKVRKSPKAVALKIAEIASDKKAQDIVVLDMRKATNICDYFVIMSCESEHKTKAISEVIEEELKKENISAKSVEGRNEAAWVVIDYLYVIVHIFYQPLRQFYNIEKLWQDAPIVVQKKKISKKKKNTHG